MTKEQYLNLIYKDQVQIMYLFYQEKIDKERHNTVLNYTDFVNVVNFMNMQGYTSKMLETCCSYYENKFNITRLKDKDGNFIKFLY
jgi:hypothetical protein